MTHHPFEKWARQNLDVVLDSAENGEWYARCPFTQNHKHGDSNPSFGINVKKGVYYCHGCHERGNFKKLSEVLRVGLTILPPELDDLDAVIDELVERSVAGDDGTEKVKVYPESWLDQYLSDRTSINGYWRRTRGLTEETIREFKLGYDPLRASATIPLRNFHGKPLGIIRRRMAKNAKPRYMYPKGFKISEHLWGAHACKGEHAIAVCEGSVDALAMWDVGVPAVALLGARISEHQAHLIHKIGCTEVVVMTDRDTPGRRAAEQVSEALSGVLVSVGRYKRSWVSHEGDKLKDPAALTPDQRIFMYEHA
jgi:DNA primase